MSFIFIKKIKNLYPSNYANSLIFYNSYQPNLIPIFVKFEFGDDT